MGTNVNSTVVRLRERLTERRDFAESRRNDEPRPAGAWTPSLAYWTGAMDGYNLALAALDAIEATS